MNIKKHIKLSFIKFMNERFNLGDDRATEEEVISNIEKGVIIKGVNLWILIFAIVVASVGLNINSAAVIIGAMLISPLMGPIMGLGLSFGIYDFDLMKRSLRNFLLAVIISLIASTIYFAITPLSIAQSELIARTTPSVWDVLVAFFGGLAGIVAQSRKDRTSTVIPGVAIATALMPPLCTAGYGLGTLQLEYFFGALYLFLINAVFISIATFVIVRFLKYEKRQLIDKAREKRLRSYMYAVTVVMIVPSIIFAYKIVNRTIFEANVQQYVNTSFDFADTQVIDYKSTYDSDGKSLEVIVVGRQLVADVIVQLKDRLKYHNLEDVSLTVRNVDGDSIRNNSKNFDKLFETSSSLIEEKNNRIKILQDRLALYSRDTIPSEDIAREFSSLVSTPKRFAITKVPTYNSKYQVADTMIICYIEMSDSNTFIDDSDKRTINRWLQTRTKCSNIKIVIEDNNTF